jgi:hypothetical protein
VCNERNGVVGLGIEDRLVVLRGLGIMSSVGVFVWDIGSRPLIMRHRRMV